MTKEKNERNVIGNMVAKGIKCVLNYEIAEVRRGAGSYVFYQPRVPADLKYKNDR